MKNKLTLKDLDFIFIVSVLLTIFTLIIVVLCSGCSALNFAPRADPGTANIEHKEYDSQGNVISSTTFDGKNDEDSGKGWGVVFARKGISVSTSGSKDAVEGEPNWILFQIGGVILALIGLASVFGKTLSGWMPGLMILPRGPSWMMVMAGGGCFCAPYMDEIMIFVAIAVVLGAGYLLSTQSNHQANGKNGVSP